MIVLLFKWLMEHPAADNPLLWELVCWGTIFVLIIDVLCLVCWIQEGYFKEPHIPRGWLRHEDKIFSIQWLEAQTNLNRISCIIIAVFITTFLLDIYKVITFILDLFWYITHAGNKFYDKYAKELREEHEEMKKRGIE